MERKELMAVLTYLLSSHTLLDWSLALHSSINSSADINSYIKYRLCIGRTVSPLGRSSASESPSSLFIDPITNPSSASGIHLWVVLSNRRDAWFSKLYHAFLHSTFPYPLSSIAEIVLEWNMCERQTFCERDCAPSEEREEEEER